MDNASDKKHWEWINCPQVEKVVNLEALPAIKTEEGAVQFQIINLSSNFILTDFNYSKYEESMDALHEQLFNETVDETLAEIGEELAEDIEYIVGDITPNNLRLKRGLSQAKLSELSGIPQPKLSNFENGKGNPTFDTFQSWAKALNVETQDLVKAYEICKG